MKKFFSAVMVALALVAVVFAAWPEKAMAGGGNQIVVESPQIEVTRDMTVALIETTLLDGAVIQKFHITSISNDPVSIAAGYRAASDDRDAYDLRFWVSLRDPNGKELNTKLEGLLKVANEGDYMLTLSAIAPAGTRLVPFVRQLPTFNYIRFTYGADEVAARWESSGNIQYPVRVSIYSFPNQVFYFADFPDVGNWRLVLEGMPKGEYYIKIFFLASGEEHLSLPFVVQ